MKFHPIADCFRLIEGSEFEELVQDIRHNGLHEAILTYEGMILDGRNRFRACEKAEVTPRFVEYEGTDPVGFVVSLNLRRRHDDESQRAMSAARLANLRNGQRADLVEGLPIGRAAEMLNVGERSVARAREVIDHGAPELVQAVDRGEVSVSAAADVAELPKEEQAQIVARGEREILEAARKIRAEKAEEKKAERIRKVEEQAAEIANGSVAYPDGLFHVISIDPPWPYDEGRSAETYDPYGRRAANPYPEMSLEQIRNLHIPSADDCVLWLWTTHKFMRHSFALLDAWGFEDKAIVTWVKDRMGLGSWLRSQSEFCIMAVKGHPVVSLTNQTTVISGPLREHSRKPDEFYAMVDSLCHGRKLDFFSREPRDGWFQFGNDMQKFA